jgi:hypothetical protein
METAEDVMRVYIRAVHDGRQKTVMEERRSAIRQRLTTMAGYAVEEKTAVLSMAINTLEAENVCLQGNIRKVKEGAESVTIEKGGFTVSKRVIDSAALTKEFKIDIDLNTQLIKLIGEEKSVYSAESKSRKRHATDKQGMEQRLTELRRQSRKLHEQMKASDLIRGLLTLFELHQKYGRLNGEFVELTKQWELLNFRRGQVPSVEMMRDSLDGLVPPETADFVRKLLKTKPQIMTPLSSKVPSPLDKIEC